MEDLEQTLVFPEVDNRSRISNRAGLQRDMHTSCHIGFVAAIDKWIRCRGYYICFVY